MIKLTDEAVMQSALRFAAEKPDFIYDAPAYDGCVYVHDGAPSCLVGNILVDLGVDVELFESLSINTDTGADAALNELIDKGIIEEPSHEVRAFLGSAQDRQDKSVPWGEAVEEALFYLK